jgi:hypothetical protein
MWPFSNNPGVLAFVLRGVLLVAALFTYLVSPDDVVWRFIKAVPRARLWEHAAFGTAAALLGFVLFQKLKASAHPRRQGPHGASPAQAVVADFLQAIAVGSLFALPGFLLFVPGNVGISLLLYGRASPSESANTRISQVARWRNAMTEHIGLCCAFVSMLAFSIVLLDRVADAMFALTAFVSIAASIRNASARREFRKRHQNL